MVPSGRVAESAPVHWPLKVRGLGVAAVILLKGNQLPVIRCDASNHQFLYIDEVTGL